MLTETLPIPKSILPTHEIGSGGHGASKDGGGGTKRKRARDEAEHLKFSAYLSWGGSPSREKIAILINMTRVTCCSYLVGDSSGKRSSLASATGLLGVLDVRILFHHVTSDFTQNLPQLHVRVS